MEDGVGLVGDGENGGTGVLGFIGDGRLGRGDVKRRVRNPATESGDWEEVCEGGVFHYSRPLVGSPRPVALLGRRLQYRLQDERE